MRRRSRSPESPRASTVEPETAELYAVALADFTRARNALATRLRQRGRPSLAEAVKALPKPTPPVWAINQVARNDGAAVTRLREAVARLRAIQQRGGASELPQATREEREAVEHVVSLVRRRLLDDGFRDSPEMLARVTGTLRGAAADPAHRDELAHGTLTRELRAPGFDVLAGGRAPAVPAERVDEPVGRARREESAEARRRRERRERAEEALRVAEAEATDWRRRAEELDRAVADRRRAAGETRKAIEALRAQLASAQARLADEERTADQAERACERARRDAEKAEARVKAAGRAVTASRRS